MGNSNAAAASCAIRDSWQKFTNLPIFQERPKILILSTMSPDFKNIVLPKQKYIYAHGGLAMVRESEEPNMPVSPPGVECYLESSTVQCTEQVLSQ